MNDPQSPGEATGDAEPPSPNRTQPLQPLAEWGAGTPESRDPPARGFLGRILRTLGPLAPESEDAPDSMMEAATSAEAPSILNLRRMSVDDVGRAVAYMAGLPLEANVATMTVMATGMPFLGRG